MYFYIFGWKNGNTESGIFKFFFRAGEGTGRYNFLNQKMSVRTYEPQQKCKWLNAYVTRIYTYRYLENTIWILGSVMG
jgi:hypothetical protein